MQNNFIYSSSIANRLARHLLTASKTSERLKEQNLDRSSEEILLRGSLNQPTELGAVIVSVEGGLVGIAAESVVYMLATVTCYQTMR